MNYEVWLVETTITSATCLYISNAVSYIIVASGRH